MRWEKEAEGEWRLLFRARCADGADNRKTCTFGLMIGLAVGKL